MKAWDNFIKAIKMASTMLLVFLVGIVGLQVVLRYFLNSPVIWFDELATWSFVWMIYLGSTALVRSNNHLTVDILIERLPKVVSQWFKIFANLLILPFLILVFYQTYNILGQIGTAPSSSMRIPMGIFFSSGLVFSLVSAVEVLRQTVLLLVSIIKKNVAMK